MAVNFPPGENPGTALILNTAAFFVTNPFGCTKPRLDVRIGSEMSCEDASSGSCVDMAFQ